MKASPSVLLLPLAFLFGCAGSGTTMLQWDFLNGPVGQDILTVTPGRKSPGQLFATLSGGRFYVSDDAGTTWTKVSTITRRGRIFQLIQDPDNRDLLYAATEQGLFLSPDRGRSWKAAPLPAVDCRTVAVDPWKTSDVYLGTFSQSIYKSTDAGLSWFQPARADDSLLTNAEIDEIMVDAMKPDVVVAALGKRGVGRSSDGGKTWNVSSGAFFPTGSRMTHVAVHPRNGDVIVCGGEAGTIARTIDAGRSWSVTRRDDGTGGILSLAVDPIHPDILLAGTESGILRSTDFGTTWSKLPTTIPPIPTRVVVGETRDGTELFAFGAGLGLQASADGGTSWSAADRNLGRATVTLVTSDPRGDNTYAAVGTSLLRLNPVSGEWTAASAGLRSGPVTSVAFLSMNPATMFATSGGEAYRSTDRGMSWTPLARTAGMSPRFIATHPTITTRMIASGLHGAFVSTDQGNSWFLAKPVGNRFSFRSLTFAPSNAGIVFAASASDGVLVTDDGGLHWDPARYGLRSDSVIAVTLGDPQGKTCFAWDSRGSCFRSTNNGLEWSPYTPPWTIGLPLHLAFDRHDPSSVVALPGDDEVYYSPTGGTTWFHLPTSGPHGEVLSLQWNAQTGILLVGTREEGVFRIALGEAIREILGE